MKETTKWTRECELIISHANIDKKLTTKKVLTLSGQTSQKTDWQKVQFST